MILGAHYDYEAFSGDCNTLTQNGCYYIEGATNAANASAGILIVSGAIQGNSTLRKFVSQKQVWYGGAQNKVPYVAERFVYIAANGSIDFVTDWYKVTMTAV